MSTVLMETLFIGVGTYLLRAGSLTLGGRMVWPEWVNRWLSLVTPAVLGALLGPLILFPSGQWLPLTHNATLLAAIPTAAVGWFSRHLLLTVAVGIISFALVSHLV